MNKIFLTTIFLILLGQGTSFSQQVPFVSSNDWAFTDALGRKVISSEKGAPKRDKTVAMFYWTWHEGNDDTSYQVKNITNIVREYPEAMKDYDHPAWGTKKPGFFFWEEPLFGYYKTTDPWVLRKHAEMLADAGVDVVFFDCTNGSLTWQDSYEALFKTWDQAQKDGVKVPKIAFLLPFGPVPHSAVSLRQLYKDVYQPGRYKNLWFIWKGKPGIMAYPDNLEKNGTDLEIANFFTFRPGQPDYVDGPTRNDQWAWLENYPQHGYAALNNGKFEQVAVGVAQNAGPSTNGHCSAFNLPGTYGRSYSKRNGFDPRVDGYLYGWNFQEQWDRAFELDPELVFVTGWNEYIAGQWLPKDSWTGDPFSFVDQFDWTHSRDIEPNKGWGDKGDVYYQQLIDNVRKFKGLDPPTKVSEAKTIKIGNKNEWDNVLPQFKHYAGNTIHRDHRGRYSEYYTNNSGRNDIIEARVARDKADVFFYVETAEKLSPSTDPNWMMLFIDVDRDKSTGWNGYDYVINRVNPKNNKAVIEKNIAGRWEWESVGTAPTSIQNNRLEIAVSRSLLKLDGKPVNFEFKWNDNMQENGNIMDFYVNGDTAPGGRFNFVYKAD
ncbi:glycoside hydrolase family 71/99 protein [Sphingobacterium endophyticum]|uniref:hypothetical protein n=1 Tax=Sphingobacterium endophyticum TaxID=2546448 RepID=UPI0012E2254B|nr:hypothetical protein [Sphingobacterium endophyticum]